MTTKYDHLIGKTEEKAVEELKKDGLEHDGINLRIIKPGCVYTADFEPTRLRMTIDKDGNVTGFGYG